MSGQVPQTIFVFFSLTFPCVIYVKFPVKTSQKMSDTVEDLNYDFNYNLFIAKTLLNNLSKHEDKSRATRWMKKLSTCNRTINEIRLRNDFMYYLIVNIQSGELQPPFNENPPQKPLPSIAHLLVIPPTFVRLFANFFAAWGRGS